jgi:hypothetical protein
MSMQSTGLSREERGPGGGGDRVRSLAETAELLDISICTLRRMIAAGEGPIVTRLSPRRLGVRDSHRQPIAVDWRSLARFCAGQQQCLSDREVSFIVSISRLHRLTEKQEKWLRDIAARLRATA